MTLLKNVLAVIVGFAVGSVVNMWLIPAPVTFIAIDLVLAYFPMAMLALWVLNRLPGRKLAGPD